MEESFFVLDGDFTFTVGEEEIPAGPSYVLVPRGTRHLLAAGAAGGRCLVLMVPGGQEDMFFELGELGSDSLRDPGVRAAIAAKCNSIPVSSPPRSSVELRSGLHASRLPVVRRAHRQLPGIGRL